MHSPTRLRHRVARPAALHAWNEGAPVADNFMVARQEWASFIPTWTTFIDGEDFRRSVGNTAGRGRLGWIVDARFWSTFWQAWSMDPLEQEREYSQAYNHLKPIVEHAGACGNTVFFDAMSKMNFPLLPDVVRNTEVLFEPRIDAECNIMDRKMLRQQYTLMGVVLSWKGGSQDGIEALERGRGTLGVQDAVDLVVRLATQHYTAGPDASELAKGMNRWLWQQALGYLLVSFPETVERQCIVRCIQDTMGQEKPHGLDLSLMATCSGYPLVDTPRTRCVAEFGQYLASREHLGEAVDASSVEVFAPLLALERIESLDHLYRACESMGLHLDTEDVLVVDGHVFETNNLDGASP